MVRYICVHTLPRGVFEDCTPYRDQRDIGTEPPVATTCQTAPQGSPWEFSGQRGSAGMVRA